MISDYQCSIIIPCFEYHPYIKQAINSALNNSSPGLACRVIIINDGSIDASHESIKEEFNSYDCITFIDSYPNRGLPYARNLGIQHADTKFICFLDSDDIISPDSIKLRISNLKNARKSDPLVVASSCSCSLISPNHTIADLIAIANNSNNIVEKIDLISNSMACPFDANAPLFLTEFFSNQRYLFNENLRSAEDYDLWIRILSDGFKFVHSDYIGTGYRQRMGSMIAKDITTHFQTCANSLATSPSSYLGSIDSAAAKKQLYCRLLSLSGFEIAKLLVDSSTRSERSEKFAALKNFVSKHCRLVIQPFPTAIDLDLNSIIQQILSGYNRFMLRVEDSVAPNNLRDLYIKSMAILIRDCAIKSISERHRKIGNHKLSLMLNSFSGL